MAVDADVDADAFWEEMKSRMELHCCRVSCAAARTDVRTGSVMIEVADMMVVVVVVVVLS